jgi:xanthosine utilization system XapX-like protein
MVDNISDTHYFYSTLSQTAAAIVGLIGAVLGSRIIEHITRLHAQRPEVQTTIDTIAAQIRLPDHSTQR